MDFDNDFVPDGIDRCPRTPFKLIGRVNRFGCPMPLLGKFSKILSTDFSKVLNLSEVLDLSLGIDKKILWAKDPPSL